MDFHIQVHLSALPKWVKENLQAAAIQDADGIHITWRESNSNGDYQSETYIRDYPREEAWRDLRRYMASLCTTLFNDIPFLIQAVIFGKTADFQIFSGTLVDIKDVCAAQNPNISFIHGDIQSGANASNLNDEVDITVDDIPF